MDLQDQDHLDGRHDQAVVLLVGGRSLPCDAAADRGRGRAVPEVDHANHAAEGRGHAVVDLREDHDQEEDRRGTRAGCSGDGPRTVGTCCRNATDRSHRCPKRREGPHHHHYYRWEEEVEIAADIHRTRSPGVLDGLEGEGRGRTLLREDLVVDRRGRRGGHCQQDAAGTEGRWWRAAGGRGVPAGGAPIATVPPMPMSMPARMIVHRRRSGLGHRWMTRWTVRPT